MFFLDTKAECMLMHTYCHEMNAQKLHMGLDGSIHKKWNVQFDSYFLFHSTV